VVQGNKAGAFPLDPIHIATRNVWKPNSWGLFGQRTQVNKASSSPTDVVLIVAVIIKYSNMVLTNLFCCCIEMQKASTFPVKLVLIIATVVGDPSTARVHLAWRGAEMHKASAFSMEIVLIISMLIDNPGMAIHCILW